MAVVALALQVVMAPWDWAPLEKLVNQEAGFPVVDLREGLPLELMAQSVEQLGRQRHNFSWEESPWEESPWEE